MLSSALAEWSCLSNLLQRLHHEQALSHTACWPPQLVLCRSLTDLTKGRLKGKLPRWFGGYFRSDADHRDFTAIGTAAGAAAASLPACLPARGCVLKPPLAGCCCPIF